MSWLIDFILHFDKHMAVFISTYGLWVYGILFGIIFCETGLVFLPFLPGDSLIFVGGAFAAIGDINYFVLLFLVMLAAIAGDSVNYFIGRKFGEKIINSTKLIKPKHLESAQSFIKKHGGKSLFLARFIPIIRTIVPFVLGMGNMEYKKFLKFNVLGGVTWVLLFLNLGYFFGNVPIVKEHFSLILIGIIFISLLPVIIGIVKSVISGNHKS